MVTKKKKWLPKKKWLSKKKWLPKNNPKKKDVVQSNYKVKSK